MSMSMSMSRLTDMVRCVMTPRSVVESSPEILVGEPVFAGTRVSVRNLID